LTWKFFVARSSHWLRDSFTGRRHQMVMVQFWRHQRQ